MATQDTHHQPNLKGCVTKVYTSYDLRASISYTRDEEVHNDNEYINGERVLASGGYLCSPNDAYFQMREVQRLYGNQNNKVQAMHTIFSFDKEQFNIKDETSAQRAIDVVTLATEMAHPNRQSVFYAQADGKGKNTHVHMLSNPTDLDGNVMNAEERSFYHASKYIDKAMEKLGYETLAKEKRQKGYTPKNKVSKGSKFQTNRVIEQYKEQYKDAGLTEEEMEQKALNDAMEDKALPRTEYAKIAVDRTIENNKVKDMETFQRYLKWDYQITYQTPEQRKKLSGRKTGAYIYDFVSYKEPANKRLTREKKLGTEYVEERIKERIKNKFGGDYGGRGIDDEVGLYEYSTPDEMFDKVNLNDLNQLYNVVMKKDEEQLEFSEETLKDISKLKEEIQDGSNERISRNAEKDKQQDWNNQRNNRNELTNTTTTERNSSRAKEKDNGFELE